MIKIYIEKNNENEIDYFKISGHANASKYGEDIVCASVSSVSQMTLNGLLEFVNNEINYEMNHGLIVCDLKDIMFSDVEKIKINILLNSMESFFCSLYEEYKKYIKLTIKEV